jgi:hypothetical protein
MRLKVFWYPCGRRHGNFGDMLTPMLLDYFDVAYEWAPAERADLVGIGSVCEKIPASFQGIIWTSGNLMGDHRNQFPEARVVALRGKLTQARTQCSNSESILLGDGGLLCHLLAPPVTKRYKLGVIPHYVDHGHEILNAIAGASSEICVIDVCDEAHKVIRQVAQCENILSSSLHGLILADSLRIPNRWLRAFGEVLGAGFKFRDYYSAFGIEAPGPLVPSATDTLDTLLSQIGDYERPNIDQLQESLMRSLNDVLGTPQAAASRRTGLAASTPDTPHARSKEFETVAKQPKESTTSRSARWRIFIVGTGRTGTCWFGDLLRTHPSIRSFVEPRPVFDLVTSMAVDPGREAELLEPALREYDRLFCRAYPFHFADKTHPALWIASHLKDHYDDSIFIALRRNVEPTVASMLQHNGVRRWCEEWARYPVPNRFLGITMANLEWYRDASVLERCVARWWSHENEIDRLVSRLGERMFTVKYERLVIEPRATLENVREFLALREPFPDVKSQRESLNKWEDYLTAKDIDRIQIALKTLSENGQVNSCCPQDLQTSSSQY